MVVADLVLKLSENVLRELVRKHDLHGLGSRVLLKLVDVFNCFINVLAVALQDIVRSFLLVLTEIASKG